MAAVSHSPSFAKKVGVSQGVGSDFVKADNGRQFAKGDDMAKKLPPFMGKESKAEEAKEMKVKAKSPAMYRKGEKAEGIHGKSGMAKPTKYAKGGGCELKGKTKAFAAGGGTGAALMEKLASLQKSRKPTPSPAMPMRPLSPRKQREADRKMGRAGPTAPQQQSNNPFANSKLGPGGVNLDAQRASGLRPASQNEFSAQRDMGKPQMQQSLSPQNALMEKIKSLRSGAAQGLAAERQQMGRSQQSQRPGMTPPPRAGLQSSRDPRSMLGAGYGKPLPAGMTPASKLAAFTQQMAGNKMPTGSQSSASTQPMKPPNMTAAGPNPMFGAMKKGGTVKKMAKGGGCEVKGKTKGRYI